MRVADHRDVEGGMDEVVVSPMPEPGDRSPGFTAEPNRCWALIYSKQLQSTHCSEAPSYTGRWFSPRGDRS